MDGTQEDEAEADDTLDDDTLDDDTLADGDGSDGPDVEKMRRLRLSGFLRELVRAEGRMEAAELLGVAYRTVVRAEESGQITGRVGDALERLLGTGDDPEVERLRERVGALEGGMEALGEGVAGRPRRDSGRCCGKGRTGKGWAGRRPGPPLRWRGCGRRSG